MNELHDPPADPRVYMAAKRTFLAWIRTGIAFMAFGFVVDRFGLFLRERGHLFIAGFCFFGDAFLLFWGCLIVAPIMLIKGQIAVSAGNQVSKT